MDKVKVWSHRIYLTDLLSQKKTSIIDIGLSFTASPGLMIRFGLIPHKKFNMTSGTPIAFVNLSESEVLHNFRQLINKLKYQTESARRYVALLKIAKRHNLLMRIPYI